MFVDLRRVVVSVELQEREAKLALRALVRSGETRAAERLDEDAMEAKVAFERLDRIAALERVCERVGRSAHRVDAVLVDAVQGGELDDAAQRVEIRDVLFGDVGDDDA